MIKNIDQEKKGIARRKSIQRPSMLMGSTLRGPNIDEDLFTDQAIPTFDTNKLKDKDKEKVQRMRLRETKVQYLLYPEDHKKESWDLFITLILLLTCFITPYRIAFGSIYEEPIGWQFVSYTIDFLFLIDIFVIFNSAFYDDEFLIVEDRKIIA